MSTQRPPWKPAYRLSGWGFRLTFVCCWVAAFMILGAGLFGSASMQSGANAMAPIYMPIVLLLILGVLGIHRVTGAADLRAIVAQGGLSRDDPVAPYPSAVSKEDGQ